MKLLRKAREYIRQARISIEKIDDCRLRLDRLIQIELQKQLLESPRFKDPSRLLHAAYKVYSQGLEDGMIEEIFNRIGTTSKKFIEFGIEDGLECNCTYLLLKGWSGTWIEASAANANKAKEIFKKYPVEIHNAFVTVENIDPMLERFSDECEVDFLCIDIDFNDYWVWKAVKSIKPRVVVIEYNATLPPHMSKTVEHDPDGRWSGSNYFGASLGALVKLAQEKDYSLVGCSPSGVNAFFVRNDQVGDSFCKPFTAENHYEPPRYELWAPVGHRAGFGPWQDV